MDDEQRVRFIREQMNAGTAVGVFVMLGSGLALFGLAVFVVTAAFYVAKGMFG